MNKRILAYLPVTMLLGGLLSVFFGKDLSWDLANYHFYNPFAFLYHRDQYDFWPSSFIHQYLNPTVDFITYFLITTVSPRLTEFILGAIHAVNAWMIFLIAREFITGKRQEWIAIFLALFGMYGTIALPGMGSFTNDNLISLFILGFVLLQIQSVRNIDESGLKIMLSGLLLGMGFGLKLTAGVFLAGAILTTLILPLSYSQRLRLLICWGSAAALGFFLTAGYWMYLQWVKHHNPLFPFFNNVFHSNEFTYENWRDLRFLPHGIMQHLFFPFYFVLRRTDTYLDSRILITFTLFVVAASQWIWQRVSGKLRSKQEMGRYWLYAFSIFSYLVWQEYFSIARYFVVGEMLAPLVIYLLVQQIFVTRTQKVLIFGLIFYIVLFTMPIPIGDSRVYRYSGSYFNVHVPVSVNAAPSHVLMTYEAFIAGQQQESNEKTSSEYLLDTKPHSYLIPFFPRSWQFTGVPFSHGKYFADNQTTQIIKQRLAKLSGPIYLLSSDIGMPAFYRAAMQFNLQPDGECQEITSDRQRVANSKELLCPVKKAFP